MEANRKHVRVKLLFSHDYHVPSWYLVDLSKTIGDLCQLISKRFHTKGKCRLSMRNFLLPDWETADILENEDEIDVEIEDNVPPVFKAELNSSPNIQPMVHVNVDEQSETVSPSKDSQDFEGKSPKKKKKKKKSKKSLLEDCNNAMSPINPPEKDRINQHPEMLINIDELVKRNYCEATSSMINSIDSHKKTRNKIPVDCTTIEDNNTAAAQTFSANKNDFNGMDGTDKHKKNNTVNAVTPNADRLEQLQASLQKLIAQGKKLDDKDKQFPSSKSAEFQKKDIVDVTSANQGKPKRRRKRKNKRRHSDETNTSVTNTSSLNNTPQYHESIFPTKLPSTKQHKHFDSDKEEDTCTDMDIENGGLHLKEATLLSPYYLQSTSKDVGKANGVHKEIIDISEPFVCEYKPANTISESTLANGTMVYKRNRKRKNMELSKFDQLNSVLTTSSEIIKNPNVHIHNKPKAQETVKVPKLEEYSELTPLVGPPRPGDRIAYKIIEMSEDYTPVLSQYQEGMVKSYDPGSNSITLKQKVVEKSFTQTGLRKFDLDVIEDEEIVLTNREQLSDEVSLNWSLILEPKLLS